MTLKQLQRKCIVDENGEEVTNLNELEIISDLVGWVKLPSSKSDQMDAVLNGIAFDPSSNDILITGKLWNRLFKIHLLFLLSFIKHSNQFQ